MNVILSGLEGWHRWSYAAAHYFVDGRHLCHTRHDFAASLPPTRPDRAELSPSGLPFGHVCARCLKLSRERRAR